jgi:hypothetical protein
MARHCIPQKQTHQIAITALRSAAPASGGLGPERCGRVPSPRHRRELRQHFVHEHVNIGKRIPRARKCRGGTDAAPMVCELGTVDDDCVMACRRSWPHLQYNRRLQSRSQRLAQTYYKQTLRQGTPRTHTRNCGKQPAHQSLITDVHRPCLPVTRLVLIRHRKNSGRKSSSHTLKSNIKACDFEQIV